MCTIYCIFYVVCLVCCISCVLLAISIPMAFHGPLFPTLVCCPSVHSTHLLCLCTFCYMNYMNTCIGSLLILPIFLLLVSPVDSLMMMLPTMLSLCTILF